MKTAVIRMALIFILLQACMGQRLLADSEDTTKTTFLQCDPFSVVESGITSCERYFSKYPTGACNLNLQWHEICSDTIPEGMALMRDLCPSECAVEVWDPEAEDFDDVAVSNFIKFLADGETRRQLGATAAKCNEGYYDSTEGNAMEWACGHHCEGGKYWTDTMCHCACLPERESSCSAFSGNGQVCGDSATERHVWTIWDARMRGTTESTCADFCEQQGQGCCEWRRMGGWCYFKQNGVKRSSLPHHDAKVSYCLPFLQDCPDGKGVSVVHIDHIWQGTNGRYFYFPKELWTAMAGSWVSGQRYRIDQYRNGQRIKQNKEVIVWDNRNGVHGRYNPYESAKNGDWQPGDIIFLAGTCD